MVGFITILLYGVLGVLLSFGGISLSTQPITFFGIFVTVILIEIFARLSAER